MHCHHFVPANHVVCAPAYHPENHQAKVCACPLDSLSSLLYADLKEKKAEAAARLNGNVSRQVKAKAKVKVQVMVRAQSSSEAKTGNKTQRTAVAEEAGDPCQP